MIAAFLGVATAGVVIAAGLLSVRHAQRFRDLEVKRHGETLEKRSVLDVVGLRIAQLPLLRRVPMPDGFHGHLAAALFAGLVVSPVSKPLAFVLAAALVGRPYLNDHRAAAKRRRAVQRDIPMAVDLIRLGVESGLNIPNALKYVARYLNGPMAVAFTEVLQQVANGRRLADALENLCDQLGDDVRPITSALLSGERYGAPLAVSLAQLARETRVDQERRAEQAARRLSVQLLFPVAGFILPAFALLTAAPLLAGSLGTLASSFH